MTTIGVKHDQVVRYSKRKKVKVDYTMYDTLTMKKDEAFIKTLLDQKFKEANVQRYEGKNITKSFLRQHGFRVPFLVPKKEGLGIEIPDNLTVEKVVELIGPETIIPVLDVHTQEGTSMKLHEWGTYWKSTKEERIKKGRLNVISLEFSYTNLAKIVKSPRVVRELDWIELCWKNRGGNCLHNYPRVQYYCLMGVEGSYTDFHIDFGGTSVWYHIVSGEKWFYMIPPTKRNLKIYQEWSKSQTQNATFLPTIIGIEECRILKFTTGMTAMLPTGWIHAVYTPKDTLVIGGNFLHGLNSGLQLEIYGIEKISGVRDKFSFPNYERMQFYALEYYGAILDGETCIDGKEGTMPSHRLSAVDYISEARKKLTIKNSLDKIYGAHLMNIYGPPGWEEEEDIKWNGVNSGFEITEPEDFENWYARRKYLWTNQLRIRRKFKVLNAIKNNDKKNMNIAFLDFIQMEDDGIVKWLNHRKNQWWHFHRKKRRNLKKVIMPPPKTSTSFLLINGKKNKKKCNDISKMSNNASSSSSSSASTTATTTNMIATAKSATGITMDVPVTSTTHLLVDKIDSKEMFGNMKSEDKRSYLLGRCKVDETEMLDETEILSKYELESLISFCKKINDDWKLPGTKKQKEYIIENLEHIPLLCLEKLWLFDESKIASVEYETDYGTVEAFGTCDRHTSL